MKNIIYSTLVFLGVYSSINAQILISDPDFPLSNPCTCASAPFIGGSTTNFFDAGGSGANYGPNENHVITFCPDANGSKVSVAFGNNAGYVWDVDGSDMVTVYDGPTTSSPVLWSGNSVTDPNGPSSALTVASWNNVSGCITIQFVSDGANQGQGWGAFVSCGTPWQPFEMHMTASIGNGEANGAGDGLNDLFPLDTGYVDVCLGDSILFTATPIFPYEPGGALGATNGGGYNQSNTYTRQWSISDGSVYTTNSFWFKPNARTGYFVELKVTDPNGQFAIINSKVRVSTIPSFATCQAVPDTLCLGQAAQLVGGITPADTAGVQGTAGNFQINGSFGQQLYLPDGSGQVYSTVINITGFPTGTTIQNLGDLDQICVDIEHSYLGDLEMWIECPNGQESAVFNAYNPGYLPGGFGGGGTFLGGANDNGPNGVIGVCETYCFSQAPGSLPSWNNGYNTMNTSFPSGSFAGSQMIVPGTYNPQGNYATDLAGCPLNGAWTLFIRDNLSIDDGFVCSWGIYFDASLNPNNETYQPYFVDEFWSPDPTILTAIDTFLLVKPVTPGSNFYTFNVEDNFGCSYDTTIRVVTIPSATINGDKNECLPNPAQFSNTFAPEGGVWSYTGPGTLTVFPNTTFINPSFTANSPGEYVVYFVDNQCNDTLSSTLTFATVPEAVIAAESVICERDTASFVVVNPIVGVNYQWSIGTTILGTNNSIGLTTSGLYTLTATNFCGSVTDTASLLVEICAIPNVITPNGDGINDYFYTRYADNYADVNLTIYNRWGRVVYKTDSYRNDWKGENMNDNSVADGVYYYIMVWNEGKEDQAGTITVFGSR